MTDTNSPRDKTVARGRSKRAPRARARAPITGEQRARVLALHADGFGRNAIAAASGVSRGSVTSIVTGAGLSFDRTATAAATEARAVDQKADRVRAAGDLLGDVQRVRLLMLEQLGKGDARGAADAGKALTAVVAAHVRMADLTPETELDQARGILGDFSDHVRLVYSALPDDVRNGDDGADIADGAA